MKIRLTALLAVIVLPFGLNAQSRNDAGLKGDAGATSGFFDASAPVNFPTGATTWWHFLDVRHSNPLNNYAMQFSGSFFDQNLFFRKTNNNASQPWSKVVLEADGKVGIGTTTPQAALDIYGQIQISGFNSATPPSDLSYGLFPYGGVGLGIFSGALNPNQGIGIWTNPLGVRTEVMRITSVGNIGIGTITPNAKLAVNGNIRAKEVKVENANWPDYVFKKNYDLPSLKFTEQLIKEKGHLPGIPSAADVKANGVDLGEMNAKLLQKIEELTLHIISQEKRILALEQTKKVKIK